MGSMARNVIPVEPRDEYFPLGINEKDSRDTHFADNVAKEDLSSMKTQQQEIVKK